MCSGQCGIGHSGCDRSIHSALINRDLHRACFPFLCAVLWCSSKQGAVEGTDVHSLTEVHKLVDCVLIDHLQQLELVGFNLYHIAYSQVTSHGYSVADHSESVGLRRAGIRLVDIKLIVDNHADWI